jgi:peroxiredoxin Q/BCP
MLETGTIAPNFKLQDQNGNSVELADYKGKKAIVLFFYPKDDTPGCTAQSCSFRDNYIGFKALGAQILGISADSTQSHLDFSTKHSLPYPILSDEDSKVRALYGVKKTLGLLPGRVSFVLDKSGVVRHSFSSQFMVSRHIDETLRAVQELATESASNGESENRPS